MKKMIISLAIVFVAVTLMGIAPAAAAQVNAEMTGSLTITGTNNRPNVTGLSVSQNSYVGYNATSDTEMGVSSTSGKATASEVLQFMVVGNQSPGQTDDNNVYQRAAGEAQEAAVTVGDPVASASWFVRGTGSLSTY